MELLDTSFTGARIKNDSFIDTIKHLELACSNTFRAAIMRNNGAGTQVVNLTEIRDIMRLIEALHKKHEEKTK